LAEINLIDVPMVGAATEEGLERLRRLATTRRDTVGV